MKLTSLMLSNYCGFGADRKSDSDYVQSAVEIPFDKDLTVIAGVNGSGKSGILKAIAGLASYLAPEISSAKRDIIPFSDDDIHHGKQAFTISAKFNGDIIETSAQMVRAKQDPRKAPEIQQEIEVLRSERRFVDKGSKEDKKIGARIDFLEHLLTDSRDSFTHQTGSIENAGELDDSQELLILNHSYTALQCTKAHAALKKQLFKEQGYLCAYTGRRVDGANSHVEHIKPQTKCEGLEDVDYHNMLACFPNSGGDKSYGYGAPVKNSGWDEKFFVSPCSEDCERRFKHSWKGKMSAADHSDKGAKYTINLIALDHNSLTDMRRKAIMGFFGFSPKAKALSTDEAKLLLRKIDTPDSSGRLRPFCFVLKQLLPKFISDK